MVLETKKEPIEHIQSLKKYLSDCSREEMEAILAYGERIKADGEKKKDKFWKVYGRNEFLKLIKYRYEYKEKMEKLYEYLDWMDEIQREKFIDEYLSDDILYSGNFDEGDNIFDTYSYTDWQRRGIKLKEGDILRFSFEYFGYDALVSLVENLGLESCVNLDLSYNFIGEEGAKAIAQKLVLKECVTLNLCGNHIGVKGAESISKMKLKDGVTLDLNVNQLGDECVKPIADNLKLKSGVQLNLNSNEIGDEGAKAISNMQLQEGVTLNLGHNKIGVEGIKAIAKNMKLKEGVRLNLNMNEIGDEGAQAIMDNMELKQGVCLNLFFNNISDDMGQKLRAWAQSYINKGINCRVDV